MRIPLTRVITENINGTFQTFCLVEQEFIAGNTTYSAILNNKAIYNGVGPAGDPISHGTAFLYYEFEKGILPGYVYSGAAGFPQPAIFKTRYGILKVRSGL